MRWFVYGVAGLPAAISPHGVFELYRQRFGIETGYRQLHPVRARTSSRNATVRLLLVGLALILINLYVALRGAVQTRATAGDGCHRAWLCLRRLAFLLARVIEKQWGLSTLVQVRFVEGLSRSTGNDTCPWGLGLERIYPYRSNSPAITTRWI